MGEYEAILKRLDGLILARGTMMRDLTTFRIGGPADYVLHTQQAADVVRGIEACVALGVPYRVIGNGSNLLVRDEGVRGMVIVTAGGLSALSREGNAITCGAGLSLTALSREALQMGLAGLEWACGIPGTVGGACAMNAGAYGGDMKQLVTHVCALEDGAIRTYAVQDGDFGYRKSAFCAPERVVLDITLALTEDDGSATARQAEYTARRREKQPLSAYSAGSTFKRPEGHFAGALIESAGLKGARIGGAQVSTLHAGFIINTGNATADDVLRLIDHVRACVLQAHGVTLECEVKIW